VATGDVALEYVTPEEMREAESRASSRGLDVATLMENAGRAIAQTIRERYSGEKGQGRVLLVVCGTGNNGGDGFVAARQLSREREVRVLILAAAPSMIKTSEARANLQRLAGEPVDTFFAGDAETLLERAGWIEDAEIILDAILGTGVRGEIREPVATAIRLINGSKAIKVAIDLPSGLDPGSGDVSSGGAVRADLTVALHRPKTGLRAREDYTGELVVVPIGISVD
jgi:NAD(P)H-hydrate epimerase